MLALTVHQPWAHLIAIGSKSIETRTWGTRHRGLLAIHASRRRPDPELCARFGLEPAGLELGKIIAISTVADSRPLTDADQELACCVTAGMVGIVFNSVARLRPPVACMGRQKLWKVPAPVLSLIRQQLQNPTHQMKPLAAGASTR